MNAPASNPSRMHPRYIDSDAGVQRHLVEAYASPLRAYYRTTPWYRVYGQRPDWQPEVVVGEFLQSFAHAHRSAPFPEGTSDRPLRARLAADLRRALRDRRRAQRCRPRRG